MSQGKMQGGNVPHLSNRHRRVKCPWQSISQCPRVNSWTPSWMALRRLKWFQDGIVGGRVQSYEEVFFLVDLSSTVILLGDSHYTKSQDIVDACREIFDCLSAHSVSNCQLQVEILEKKINVSENKLCSLFIVNAIKTLSYNKRGCSTQVRWYHVEQIFFSV